MNKRTSEDVRQAVSTAYAGAVTKKGGGGCCGPMAPKGLLATLAGYSDDELRALPKEAVESAFGCGNPTAFAEVQEGQTVLDLGSGAGIDLLLAARKVGPTGRAIGVDMTDEMIEKARANVASAGLTNVEVRKGIIEDLPIETASVDWVISNCVINLSPEKDRVFREVARVLRPNGQMLVSDIVAQDLPDWVLQNEVLHNACIAGAVSEPAYLAGLEAAGLEHVEVRDRLVYDADQIAAFFEEDPLVEKAFGCCGGVAKAVARPLAESLVGKVWSARVYARKPA